MEKKKPIIEDLIENGVDLWSDVEKQREILVDELRFNEVSHFPRREEEIWMIKEMIDLIDANLRFREQYEGIYTRKRTIKEMIRKLLRDLICKQ